MTHPPLSPESDALAALKLSDECRLNPLWIETSLGGEAALEISVQGLGLRSGLETFFRRVEQYPVTSLASLGPSSPIDFPDRTFDLVTLYGRKPGVLALQEIVRVLKPSGTLYLGVENRLWIGRLRESWVFRYSGSSSAGPGLARLVRSVGFSIVRQYFLFPSLAGPRQIVPANVSPLRAHETIRRREGETGILRFTLVKLRLFQFLYPGRLIIARF